jgi:beta-galactosidase GanA
MGMGERRRSISGWFLTCASALAVAVAASLAGAAPGLAQPLSEHGQCAAATGAQAAKATPGAPTDVHATGGNGSVTVTWCSPAKGQSHVTGFTVKSSTGQTFTASVPNDYVIATAPNGTPVSYTVTANTSGTSGPASGKTNTVTPAPIAEPTDVDLSTPQSVSYDQYSLMIGGQRMLIYAGEFDPWRLPSPSLWLDRLQKMKADGYNAVTVYFDWDYSSPAPGVYDFTGIRDMNEFLNMAQQAGLYVIARPGPYINAETDGGGFPGWLVTQSGVARTDAPDFEAASDQWLSEIDPIIAAHQITRGGDVILYQAENELYSGLAPSEAYMAEVEAKAKADGIVVPIIGNEGDTFEGTAANPDIPGYDSYPDGFNCSDPKSVAPIPTFSPEPGKPLELPEFQGGSYDSWGGAGYAKCYKLTGQNFENAFYKSNLAQGTTIQSNYMGVGGTNWGWLPAPFMYSSYDYGAGIMETGEIGTPSHPGNLANSKYGENKLIGDFAQAVPSLAQTVSLAAPPTTNPLVTTTARVNPTDGTQFIDVQQANASSRQSETTHIALDLSQGGSYTYDDADTTDLQYSGNWSHASNQSYTSGDYDDTESFSQTAGDSVSVTFTGTAVEWIAPTANNHGFADVYLDGEHVATVDGYSATTDFQRIEYLVSGLSDTAHTLKIVVSGQKNSASSGTYVSVDAINVPTASELSEIYPSVPQGKQVNILVPSREAKLLVANDAFDGEQLQYSTSQLMTQGTIAGEPFALLYGDADNYDETVLRYASRPTVTVLTRGSDLTTHWDAARGDMRLDYYGHNGILELQISGGGRPPLLLLLMPSKYAEQFWPESTAAGSALVESAYLVRTASTSGSTIALTGDASEAGPIRVWAPSGITQVTWNGAPVTTTTERDGSLEGTIPGPAATKLPKLTGWQFRFETPEAQPGYDDSTWTLADHPTTTNPTAPVTTPVLFADDYGFHQGFIWYRGHFTANGSETGITLTAGEGSHGAFSVWLNGVFLGSNQSGSEAAKETFSFPSAALKVGQDNVIAVLVQSSGHDEDGAYSNATPPPDSQKAPRGLLGAALNGSSAPVSWRLQGNQGGEDLQDPVRGHLNATGLYGTNAGWDLPGDPDLGWRRVTLPDSWTARGLPAGIGWYRTSFTLAQGSSGYRPIAVQLGNHVVGAGSGDADYRAFVFVNGYLMGQYDNVLGPQHRFYIPAGVVNDNGSNTLAIAVWGLQPGSGQLPAVWLQSVGKQTGGVPVSAVAQPAWDATTYGAPTDATPTLGVGASAAVAQPGASVKVTATLGNPSPSALTDASITLAAPSGWTVTQTGSRKPFSVAAGASRGVTFTVTIPSSGLTPGPADLVATAQYTEAGTAQSQMSGAQLQVPVSSLAASFDNTGITDESDTQPGGPGFLGFDGEGSTFAAQGLASVGVSPGSTVSAGGLSFTWPDVPAGQPDNTMAQGQIIAASGSGSTLGFLASTNNQALSGSGVVYYTDGTAQTFSLNIGNFWYASGTSGNPSNTTAFSEPTIDYPSGPISHTSYVFEQSVAIDPSKTVEAVQLPSLGDVSSPGNPALHVFGIAIGP